MLSHCRCAFSLQCFVTTFCTDSSQTVPHWTQCIRLRKFLPVKWHCLLEQVQCKSAVPFGLTIAKEPRLTFLGMGPFPKSHLIAGMALCGTAAPWWCCKRWTAWAPRCGNASVKLPLCRQHNRSRARCLARRRFRCCDVSDSSPSETHPLDAQCLSQCQ